MKKVSVFLGVIITAIAANAGILNWQVGSNSFNENDIGYAKLYKGSSYGAGEFVGANIKGQGFTPSEIGNDGNFYVEFLNYENEVVGLSEVKDYASLAQYITDDLVSVPAAVWHAKAEVVPEPTSAMMMLFGVAFLGLKRRKA